MNYYYKIFIFLIYFYINNYYFKFINSSCLCNNDENDISNYDGVSDIQGILQSCVDVTPFEENFRYCYYNFSIPEGEMYNRGNCYNISGGSLIISAINGNHDICDSNFDFDSCYDYAISNIYAKGEGPCVEGTKCFEAHLITEELALLRFVYVTSIVISLVVLLTETAVTFKKDAICCRFIVACNRNCIDRRCLECYPCCKLKNTLSLQNRVDGRNDVINWICQSTSRVFIFWLVVNSFAQIAFTYIYFTYVTDYASSQDVLRVNLENLLEANCFDVHGSFKIIDVISSLEELESLGILQLIVGYLEYTLGIYIGFRGCFKRGQHVKIIKKRTVRYTDSDKLIDKRINRNGKSINVTLFKGDDGKQYEVKKKSDGAFYINDEGYSTVNIRIANEGFTESFCDIVNENAVDCYDGCYVSSKIFCINFFNLITCKPYRAKLFNQFSEKVTRGDSPRKKKQVANQSFESTNSSRMNRSNSIKSLAVSEHKKFVQPDLFTSSVSIVSRAKARSFDFNEIYPINDVVNREQDEPTDDIFNKICGCCLDRQYKVVDDEDDEDEYNYLCFCCKFKKNDDDEDDGKVNDISFDIKNNMEIVDKNPDYIFCCEFEKKRKRYKTQVNIANEIKEKQEERRLLNETYIDKQNMQDIDPVAATATAGNFDFSMVRFKSFCCCNSGGIPLEDVTNFLLVLLEVCLSLITTILITLPGHDEAVDLLPTLYHKTYLNQAFDNIYIPDEDYSTPCIVVGEMEDVFFKNELLTDNTIILQPGQHEANWWENYYDVLDPNQLHKESSQPIHCAPITEDYRQVDNANTVVAAKEIKERAGTDNAIFAKYLASIPFRKQTYTWDASNSQTNNNCKIISGFDDKKKRVKIYKLRIPDDNSWSFNTIEDYEPKDSLIDIPKYEWKLSQDGNIAYRTIKILSKDPKRVGAQALVFLVVNTYDMSVSQIIDPKFNHLNVDDYYYELINDRQLLVVQGNEYYISPFDEQGAIYKVNTTEIPNPEDKYIPKPTNWFKRNSDVNFKIFCGTNGEITKIFIDDIEYFNIKILSDQVSDTFAAQYCDGNTLCFCYEKVINDENNLEDGFTITENTLQYTSFGNSIIAFGDMKNSTGEAFIRRIKYDEENLLIEIDTIANFDLDYIETYKQIWFPSYVSLDGVGFLSGDETTLLSYRLCGTANADTAEEVIPSLYDRTIRRFAKYILPEAQHYTIEEETTYYTYLFWGCVILVFVVFIVYGFGVNRVRINQLTLRLVYGL